MRCSSCGPSGWVANTERGRRHGAPDPGRPRREPGPRPSRRVRVHRRGSLPGPGGDPAVPDGAAAGRARCRTSRASPRCTGPPTAGGSAARARPLAAATHDPDRRGRGHGDEPCPGRTARSWFPRDRARRVGRPPPRRDQRPVRGHAGGLAPDGRRRPGPPAANHWRRSPRASGRPSPRSSPRSPRGARPAPSIAARSPATATRRRRTCPGRSWSPTTGSSRSAC